MNRMILLFSIMISSLSLTTSGFSGSAQSPSCDNKEIAKAYSSKELPDSARYLRFFRNETEAGYELNIRDCPDINSEGFRAFSKISATMLQQALNKIQSSILQPKTGYSLMLFSDVGVLQALFVYLVVNLKPEDCEHEKIEIFPIDMYAFQIDNELTDLFPNLPAPTYDAL